MDKIYSDNDLQDIEAILKQLEERICVLRMNIEAESDVISITIRNVIWKSESLTRFYKKGE